MTLPVVGLTGGIASGKSTVAGMLEGLGARVIDADALAREVVEPGTDGLREIVEHFGDGVIDADGRLDRKALAAIVFADPSARARLNAITHPRIARLSAQRRAALADSGAPYILYEAALLVESGAHRGMDALVVVALDPAAQRSRLQSRDGMAEDEAGARIEAQAPLEAKLAAADYVIENHGDLTELQAQCERVHQALVERFEEEAK